jgi:hypothetical protein
MAAQRLKRPRRAQIVALVLSVLFFATGTGWGAERRLSTEQEREFEEYKSRKNKKNFSNWDGILFFCSVSDHSPRAHKEICRKTTTNAAFLASTGKINFIKARDGFDFGYRGAVDGHLLLLEVELVSTKSGAPSAISVVVKAYAHHDGKTSAHGIEGPVTGGVRRAPRTGNLIFWERSLIGASAGSVDNLVDVVSQNVEQVLKEFFTDYMNAQR